MAPQPLRPSLEHDPRSSEPGSTVSSARCPQHPSGTASGQCLGRRAGVPRRHCCVHGRVPTGRVRACPRRGPRAGPRFSRASQREKRPRARRFDRPRCWTVTRRQPSSEPATTARHRPRGFRGLPFGSAHEPLSAPRHPPCRRGRDLNRAPAQFLAGRGRRVDQSSYRAAR